MKKLLKRTNGRVCSYLLWAGIFTSLALAQLPTATILGVVKDSSGAVVPDTALTARNVETGQTRTAISAADGSYRFSALPVGAYEVRAEHPGFQAAVRSGLRLAISQEAVVNLTLEVGAVTETVSVTGEAPLVNTTSGSLGGLVGEQKVADLPLNGRNYIDLTLLQPGITQHRDTGTNPAANGLWFSSNGAPVRSNNYLLDGASMVNMYGIHSASAGGETPGLDGIREYRVITNNFSAEYGMSMGSQVVLVTKSGTNSFHGDVFEYLRNSALDARNFFDYKTAITPGFRLPPFRRNQFGGSAGGPIKKDKTFVYGVYEGLRERLGISTVDNTLGAGCHGPAGATITNTRCPQLGAVPSVTISPVTAPMVGMYPLPNLGSSQFTFPFTQPTRDDYAQIRVDQTISSNDSLFGRYTVDDADQNTLPPGQPVPHFTTIVNSRNQFGTLSESHVFSPALLNTARLSYSRTAPNATTAADFGGPQFAMVPAAQNPNLWTGPWLVGGLTTYGPQTSIPSYLPQNIFTVSDDLFYTRGKHSLKFGTLINRYQQYLFSSKGYLGQVQFSNVAGLLGGSPTSFQANTPGSNYARTYRHSSLGFYAQDDYRLTSRLTVNLGFRYEFATQLDERYGVQSSVQDILHDSAPTVGLPYLDPSKHDFSPRVGFAWDVTGNGKTAVRGGFGIFYDLNPLGSPLNVILGTTKPFASSSVVTNPPAGLFTLPLTFRPQDVSVQVSTMDYHFQQPRLLSYNLTMERQLPGAMALTLAYAGSRGIHLLGLIDGNPTIPQVQSDGRLLFPVNALRRNPNFPASIQEITADSDSYYNSFQFGLTKQLSKGLQFQSSYTWSKLIDDGQGWGADYGVNASASNGYPLWGGNRALDRGPAAFDVTQNWRFNAIYRLPELSSGNGIVKGFVNGWQASSIVSLQDGYPFPAGLQANRSRTGTYYSSAAIDRPDLVVGRNGANIVSGTTAGCSGVTAGQQLGTPNLYFDPCAFAIPTAGFLGTAGRDILRGPGLLNLDFSVVKDTAIKHLGESGRLEFRAEFFNILNRANFQLPNRIVYSGALAAEPALSTAGVITGTSTPSRQIQLALKLIF